MVYPKSVQPDIRYTDVVTRYLVNNKGMSVILTSCSGVLKCYSGILKCYSWILKCYSEILKCYSGIFKCYL